MTKCKFCRCDPAVEGKPMCDPCWEEWSSFWRKFNAAPAMVETPIGSFAVGMLSFGLALAFAGAFVWLHKHGGLAWPI